MMKRLIMLAGMTAFLLSGCSSVVEDPAAVITGKPDQARGVALASAMNSAISEIESTRTADEVSISNPVIEGFTAKSKPHADGANYCLVVTDNETKESKTYTSVNGKVIEGNICPE